MKQEQCKNEQPMMTDLLGELCRELSNMFYSLSSVVRTCMGLKEQLSKSIPQDTEEKEGGKDGESII